MQLSAAVVCYAALWRQFPASARLFISAKKRPSDVRSRFVRSGRRGLFPEEEQWLIPFSEWRIQGKSKH